MSRLIISEHQNIDSIADAVRGKTGETKEFTIDEMISSINNISSGIDTSDATASVEDIANGKTAYVNGSKITGTHECEEVLDTSDATATGEDILNGKTAYVNGVKITGTHECCVDVVTTTIKESQANYSYSLTIPELIGAKYFVIKGNYLTAYQFGSSDIINNSGTIHTLLYIDGKMIVYYSDLGANNGQCDMACSVEMTSGWSFDETTGTISFVDYCFSKFTTDTTEGDVAYTVYRFG